MSAAWSKPEQQARRADKRRDYPEGSFRREGAANIRHMAGPVYSVSTDYLLSSNLINGGELFSVTALPSAQPHVCLLFTSYLMVVL